VAGAVIVGLCAGASAYVWTTGSQAIARRPVATFALPVELPVERVVLTQDGAPDLVGWIVARPGSCGAVVLLHGRGSSKQSLVARARMLFDAGYSVLLFDLSGHGESGGEVQGFGYAEGADAGRIHAFARDRFSGGPVGAIGNSLGAAALVFATPDARADAYVLEQLYATLWETTALRAALPYLRGLQATVLLAQMPFRLGYSAADVRPVDRIGEIDRPILLLAGEADRFVDPGQTLSLQAASGAQLVWFEGTGHGDLERRDSRKYREAVLPFLARNLCDPAAPPQ
jgi:pimeloyl-ACP methyl ester carboxylesterase